MEGEELRSYAAAASGGESRCLDLMLAIFSKDKG